MAKARALLAHLPEFRITKAVIFGSRVRGDFLAHSDLDLILVSEDFRSMSFPDRPSRVRWDEHWDEDYAIELLCYTPEEFERKRHQIGMVRDALEYGLVLEPP